MMYSLNWQVAVGYWKTVGYELVHDCFDRMYSEYGILRYDTKEDGRIAIMQV